MVLGSGTCARDALLVPGPHHRTMPREQDPGPCTRNAPQDHDTDPRFNTMFPLRVPATRSSNTILERGSGTRYCTMYPDLGTVSWYRSVVQSRVTGPSYGYGVQPHVTGSWHSHRLLEQVTWYRHMSRSRGPPSRHSHSDQTHVTVARTRHVVELLDLVTRNWNGSLKREFASLYRDRPGVGHRVESSAHMTSMGTAPGP